jgi:hypothetical protein
MYTVLATSPPGLLNNPEYHTDINSTITSDCYLTIHIVFTILPSLAHACIGRKG